MNTQQKKAAAFSAASAAVSIAAYAMLFSLSRLLVAIALFGRFSRWSTFEDVILLL